MELKEQVETPDLVVSETIAEQTFFPAPASAPTPEQPVNTRSWAATFAWLKQACKQYTVVVPLVVLAVLFCSFQIWIVWVGSVLLWSAAEAIYPKLPATLRMRILNAIPERWKKSRFVHEMIEGVGQVRPFILFSMYLIPPIGILWIAGHWFKSRFSAQSEEAKKATLAHCENIVFTENKRRKREEEESNFIHSPAFGVTCVLLFVCGLPAAMTLLLYQKLGVDAVFGFPSADPHFTTNFVKIGLYIYSVSWCLCLLFFRTWMTFPLNYAGSECTVELTPQMVKRRSNNWLTQAATLNQPWGGRYSMAWDEMRYLGYDAPHMVKMYPLPVGPFPATSIIYKLVNKFAQFYDGVVSRLSTSEYVYFTTAESRGEMGALFKMNLTDLDAEQRAQLFYAVRKYAPHVVIDPRVQDLVVGTSVMQAPRYTQMWFELLTDKMPRKRLGALASGDKLQSGSIEVRSRLKSGGQANVYVAEKDGAEVVLKEFILSHADAVGALVESAGEFETESTLLSELKHEHIVEMLDFFAEDRRLYIVLERIAGSSLREHVKTNGPLSEEQTIAVALQVSEVLEYLHSQSPSVVHRDIAPDNVMLSPDGSIKVIDFSLAAAKKSRRTTSTMGKHSYAPPEQLREQPCPQSDIYALGATMYFLLTGTDPRPITQSDVLAKRGDISPELAGIIKHATELDVENRYSDIKWLRLELQKLKESGVLV
jgi:tRNA A-37 threonylcarbamoyl transferase component Bud32